MPGADSIQRDGRANGKPRTWMGIQHKIIEGSNGKKDGIGA
jgi:hypothetical protein